MAYLRVDRVFVSVDHGFRSRSKTHSETHVTRVVGANRFPCTVARIGVNRRIHRSKPAKIRFFTKTPTVGETREISD